MDFDLVDQLAIIAEDHSVEMYKFTALVLFGFVLSFSAFLAVKLERRLRKPIAFLSLVAIGVILACYAGFKPRIDVWPDGVSDAGSMFDTNNWSFVEFKWKLREGHPTGVPLTFWRSETGLPGSWLSIGEEQSGALAHRFYSGSAELPDNPTNYIYKVTSDYVPPAIPSITLVSATASNVTIGVVAATNYLGHAAVWEARRKIWADRRHSSWGPWTDLGQAVVFNATNMTKTVSGNFVNGRKNTELRLKMTVSDEGSNGVILP